MRSFGHGKKEGKSRLRAAGAEHDGEQRTGVGDSSRSAELEEGGWERPRGEVQERVLLCLAEQLELWAAGGWGRAGGAGGLDFRRGVASGGPRFSRS